MRFSGTALTATMPQSICNLREQFRLNGEGLLDLTADCDQVLCDDDCCTSCQDISEDFDDSPGHPMPKPSLAPSESVSEPMNNTLSDKAEDMNNTLFDKEN